MEYTSKDEIAVCNLASLSLPMFVEDKKFNHEMLYTVTKRVTRNLNKVIDRNYYPVQEAENSISVYEKVEKILKLDLSKYQLSCIVPFGYRINEQSTQLRESFENIVEYIK